MSDISVILEGSKEPVYAIDVAEPIAKWLTVGVVAALLIAGIVIFFAARKVFVKYVKFAGIGAIAYAATLGVVMLSLEIAKKYSESYADKYALSRNDLISHILFPLVIVCGMILIGVVTLSLIYKFKRNAFKIAGYIFGVLILAAVVVAAALIGMYYSAHIANDGYFNSDDASVSNLGLYLSMGILIVIAVLIGIFFGRGDKKGFDTKTIAYASVCVALSFALSYIKLFEMPQGGSVTLASLLPLMVFSYMFGIRKGLFVGLLYGLLQALQDPFIIHPAQFLLDYPIAFAFIGIAGIFAKVRPLDKVPQIKFALGAIVACSIRFVTHVLSGVFAFQAYAGGGNALVYSLSYNSFVFVDMLITIAAGVLLFSSKSFIKLISQYNRPVKSDLAVKRSWQNDETPFDVSLSQQSADRGVTSETDGLAHTDTSAKNDK